MAQVCNQPLQLEQGTEPEHLVRCPGADSVYTAPCAGFKAFKEHEAAATEPDLTSSIALHVQNSQLASFTAGFEVSDTMPTCATCTTRQTCTWQSGSRLGPVSQAWMRSRGEGGTATITADTMAERFGVVQGSYTSVPLPQIRTYTVSPCQTHAIASAACAAPSHMYQPCCAMPLLTEPSRRRSQAIHHLRSAALPHCPCAHLPSTHMRHIQHNATQPPCPPECRHAVREQGLQLRSSS